MTTTNDRIRQAGCVPYRFREQKLELCLITTRKGRWGFPKGIIDPGETPEETALKESYEEAGLVGTITGEPLGAYRYRKWGTQLLVTVFAMNVTQVEASWDESWRQREWFSPDAAREIIDREELLPFVDAIEKRLFESRAG